MHLPVTVTSTHQRALTMLGLEPMSLTDQQNRSDMWKVKILLTESSTGC